MTMFSEMLREMDRNTIRYMVDDMKEQIEKGKVENAALQEQITEARGQLADINEELAEKNEELAEKNGKLAEKDAVLAQKEAEIARLKALLADAAK